MVPTFPGSPAANARVKRSSMCVFPPIGLGRAAGGYRLRHCPASTHSFSSPPPALPPPGNSGHQRQRESVRHHPAAIQELGRGHRQGEALCHGASYVFMLTGLSLLLLTAASSPRSISSRAQQCLTRMRYFTPVFVACLYLAVPAMF